ncbi:MAG TPA: hypothetical protein VD997_07125 [Phycisphaerales bacterium]|nr:hypothetical protein [Phycisphaerales bacterium]
MLTALGEHVLHWVKERASEVKSTGVIAAAAVIIAAAIAALVVGLRPTISAPDMTITVLRVVLERAKLVENSGPLELDVTALPDIGHKINRVKDGWNRPVRVWRTADGYRAQSRGPDGAWDTSDDVTLFDPDRATR